jgi:hypothetical protein
MAAISAERLRQAARDAGAVGQTGTAVHWAAKAAALSGTARSLPH